MTTTGVEWLAAVVAPWTVSIHPNFTAPIKSDATRLALVVERRHYDSDEELVSDALASGEGYGTPLLAASSLSWELQEKATEGLFMRANDKRLSFGERAASAAFGALGLFELDRPEDAADALTRLERTGRGLDPRGFADSHNLIQAYLLLLLTARLQDARQFDLAREACTECLAILETIDRSTFEPFDVTEGISWGSDQVQIDILETLRRRALGEWGHLQFMRDDSWTEAVRSKATWIDYRVAGVFEERDSRVLLDEWEARYESNSGKIVMGRTPVSELAYAAYLIAELSGSTSLMSRAREVLGRLRLLTGGNAIFDTREGIRLLRQADSTGPLQTALRFIRAEGPSDALYREARTVLDRSPSVDRVTETDLLVLDFASDLLDPDELHRGIQLAERLTEVEQLNGPAGWSANDRMWRTLRSLVPGSGAESEIAEKAFRVAVEGVDEPIVSTLGRVLEGIDWALVAEPIRNRWRDWYLESDDDTELRETVREKLELKRTGELRDLLGVARVLDDHDHEPSIAQRDEAQGIVRAALAAEKEQAARGVLSFGGGDAGDIAVAFAIRFDSREVWADVVDLLTSPAIDAVLKARSLERISNFPSDVPDLVRRSLANNWQAIASSPSRMSFARAKVADGFPEALRAGAALKIVSDDAILDQLMLWSSGDDGSRFEAARSVPSAVSAVRDATWAYYLLLQLSYDENVDVRAETAHAIARVLAEHETDTPAQLIDRLKSLLTADGISVPLRTIHALQRYGLKGALSPLEPTVRAMAEAETPRILSSAARLVIGADRLNS
ncbi:hypothetical protein [Leifsonia poae]|uniref:Uncharacterized protein n=1 Tax=Leifsonia poae TaxID=110933 RepID=A0A9W6H8C9_9MICO|nr:hypothetical protein [Leifsonia poae]GLJ75348.1 hypothetical protein GCM10017584_09220 [Leifsonia poae]